MFIKHIFDAKFKDLRYYIFKKNLDHIILYCSLITILLSITMIVSPLNQTLITISTSILVLYFIIIIAGIYIQKKQTNNVKFYSALCLLFFLITVIWLIVFALNTEHMIQFYYFYVLIFLTLSAFITIFPLIHTVIILILSSIGLFLTAHYDLTDSYYYLFIGLLGIYAFSSNYFRYHQTFKYFQLRKHIQVSENVIQTIHNRDHLTNLYNNKYVFEQIKHAKEMYTRYHSPFSIMFIDLDSFRLINEKYGQVFGDETIVILSNIIIASCRSTDIAARFGGKKFLVLMENTNLHDSLLLAERIRVTTQANNFEIEENITVSIGLNTYNGTDIDAFIKETDLLLREAKSNGKNNVQY